MVSGGSERKPTIKPMCTFTSIRMRERVHRDDEQRDGARTRRRTNPPWALIEGAIRRLDGATYTEVTLERSLHDDLTVMTVAGGLSERVICFVTRPRDRTVRGRGRYVVDLQVEDVDATIAQVVGGQLVAMPAPLNIRMARAIQAARYFATHAALDPRLHWRISRD